MCHGWSQRQAAALYGREVACHRQVAGDLDTWLIETSRGNARPRLILAARPSRFYIAADGPRDHSGEEELRADARHVASQVDWPCEVKTLFRERNLGCRKRVSTAIDWFFEHEEEGIILEDDCLPSRCFFAYCSTLLE